MYHIWTTLYHTFERPLWEKLCVGHDAILNERGVCAFSMLDADMRSVGNNRAAAHVSHSGESGLFDLIMLIG